MLAYVNWRCEHDTADGDVVELLGQRGPVTAGLWISICVVCMRLVYEDIEYACMAYLAMLGQ